MKPSLYLCTLASSCLLALGTAKAESVEQQLKTLPAPVYQTLAAQSPPGAVKSIEAKTVDGAMRYKVKVKDHGKSRTLVIAAAGALLVTKTEVQSDALPAPVRKTLDAQSQGAKVEKSSLVSQDGKTCYEVELEVSDHKKELVILPGGELTRIEEVVPISTIPAPVKSAIDKTASRGKLVKVKTIVVRGKLTAYEAVVEVDGLKTEFQLTPDGQPRK